MIRLIAQKPMTRTMSLLRDLFSLSTPQFIVLLLGVSMLVVATVHMPRRQQNDLLESRLNSLESQEMVLSRRLEQTYSQLVALEKDRFYRREALRKLTGQNLTGERLLREHLDRSQQAERYLRDSQ
ncbi:MAG: hypothetical protein COB10_03850 [Planctomycetota bacterium]|nr:MAG: hypothetical protein COB10_03850 [Planctomycetota bacterium]HIC23319.1 hypothetical protein [Planctomycetota bacterium]